MGSFVVAMPPPEQLKTAAQAKQLHQRLLDGQHPHLHASTLPPYLRGVRRGKEE